MIRSASAARGHRAPRSAATKALGQNFLLDEQLTRTIAAIPGDLTGNDVFEVGPGPGGLTRVPFGRCACAVLSRWTAAALPALESWPTAFPGR
jgi:16S rRNA (adenine1518-N6/adenine1519-N6)-dimethyltransferase